MSNEVNLDTVDRLIALFKSKVDGKPFVAFYNDDPGIIPAFNLPALVVTVTRDDTESGAYEQDDVTETVLVKVIFDKKADYENDKANPGDMTQGKIRKLVGERDKTTGHYLPATIKGTIREFATEGITAIAGSMSTEYGVQPRENGISTAEAHVTFTIQYTVDIDEAV